LSLDIPFRVTLAKLVHVAHDLLALVIKAAIVATVDGSKPDSQSNTA
jgi:hypothetical protein